MTRLLAAVLITLAPAIAAAQSAIEGRVTDVGGNPLPGVTVTVSLEGGTAQTVVTNREGRYTVPGLAEGAYVVEFHLPGFTPAAQFVRVGRDRPVSVDAKLRVGAIEGVQVLPFGPPPPRALPDDPRCLHGATESPSEAMRRTEALAAMRLIYSVIEPMVSRGLGPLPTWESLSNSRHVAALRGRPDALGELARRIQWGAAEPLPGWGIAYLVRTAEIRFALVDLRDPCGFSYSSTDPGVIPRGMRILPLDAGAVSS